MLNVDNNTRRTFSRSEDGNPFAALRGELMRADMREAERLREDRQARQISRTDSTTKQVEAQRIGIEMGFIVADPDADEMDAPEGADLDTMIREGSL